MNAQIPGNTLRDLQDQPLKRLLTRWLILSIDDIQIFLLEYIRPFLLVLALDLDYHVFVDVLEGGIVDLLLELLESFGDGLHLAVEGFFPLVFAQELLVFFVLHVYYKRGKVE